MIMAAAPRKFSDKIALLTQRQIEGTAAFDAILREVSDTTRVTLLSCFCLQYLCHYLISSRKLLISARFERRSWAGLPCRMGSG